MNIDTKNIFYFKNENDYSYLVFFNETEDKYDFCQYMTNKQDFVLIDFIYKTAISTALKDNLNIFNSEHKSNVFRNWIIALFRE